MIQKIKISDYVFSTNFNLNSKKIFILCPAPNFESIPSFTNIVRKFSTFSDFASQNVWYRKFCVRLQTLKVFPPLPISCAIRKLFTFSELAIIRNDGYQFFYVRLQNLNILPYFPISRAIFNLHKTLNFDFQHF